MQHISIIAVGKTTGVYTAAVDEYAKRLQPYCRFEIVEIAEEPINEKNASPALVKAALQKEGARILAAVPKGAGLVALCIEGKQMGSDELAGFISQAAGSGTPAIAFVIGSSHGLADEVKQAAVRRLSLSKMTLPHQLARLILTEQIYRGMMINANSRYHK